MNISIEAIEHAAAGMKEDLQRKANQGILRNDLNRAMAALAGIGHIDAFVQLLTIRAGSQFDNYVATKRGRGRPRKEHPGQLPLVGVAGPELVAAKKQKSG
jgi:hypothetical protein